MTTYKDILYKKNDDETWTEWTKRVPDNDEDKRNYISDTIYVKIYENDEEKAGKITGMLLNLDVEELIVLLESNDLLEDKIKEEYQVLRELEEYKMFEEECLSAEEELKVVNEELRVANEACRVLKEEEQEKVDKEEEEEEKSKEEKEEENENRYEEDDDDYKQPVVTLTVAEMIAALSKLPPDAKLVMTESGFYSNSEFAEVMLPRPYKVENDRWDCDLPTGTEVYIIGHSHQSY